MKRWILAYLIIVGFLFFVGIVFSQDVIRIGLQAPITGSFAIEGQMAKQCVELAAEIINEQG
ncbi:MAG: ABC transporter substrate-binding protein, partial [Candidatus Caldatribacteriaceae bacterium]